MRGVLFATLALIPPALLLSGCPAASTGGPTWTVSGTITSTNLNIGQGDVSIVVAGSTIDDPVSILPPNANDTSGTQIASYSCSGPGAVTGMSLTITSTNGFTAKGISCTFTMLGATYPLTSNTSSSPQTFTLPSSINITGSTTIDIALATSTQTKTGK